LIVSLLFFAAAPTFLRKVTWALSPMFSFIPEIRKNIYTTNAIESLKMTLRKVIKNRAEPMANIRALAVFRSFRSASKY
jgi:transposase-like protein